MIRPYMERLKLTNMKVTVLIDGNRGIYIPQQFAKTTSFDPQYARGFEREDINILLAGPNHEDYWDAWQNVLLNCQIVVDDREPVWYNLFEDGDLFAVPESFEWDENGQEWVHYAADIPDEEDIDHLLPEKYL